MLWPQRGTASAHQFARDANSEALRLFQKAIWIDPNFAAPYGGAHDPKRPSIAIVFDPDLVIWRRLEPETGSQSGPLPWGTEAVGHCRREGRSLCIAYPSVLKETRLSNAKFPVAKNCCSNSSSCRR
jgi:hypothetical protein